MSPVLDYTRKLEDACLILWRELPVEQVKVLREEIPDLVEFLRNLHLSVEHDQAMTRVSVWAHKGER